MRTGVGMIAAIYAIACGSGSQAGGMTRRAGAGVAACVNALQRDAAAATAISSPEASGTRTELSSFSFADAFALTSLCCIIQNGGVT
jgi:hypothetical protein